jgi:hypothetical protein
MLAVPGCFSVTAKLIIVHWNYALFLREISNITASKKIVPENSQPDQRLSAVYQPVL